MLPLFRSGTKALPLNSGLHKPLILSSRCYRYFRLLGVRLIRKIHPSQEVLEAVVGRCVLPRQR